MNDTGIGIAREEQFHVFERFVQVDASNARRHGGRGLGTTIAKHLVTMMGGRIGLESELGVGSRFWFTVRARVATEADLPSPEAAAAAALASD